MPNENFVELSVNVGNPALQINRSVATPLVFEKNTQIALAPRAAMFQKTLNTGRMLVRSASTGEVKSIDVENAVQTCSDVTLSNYHVKDNRVQPKQNYSKVDSRMVNIYSHKGPDENKNNNQGGFFR